MCLLATSELGWKDKTDDPMDNSRPVVSQAQQGLMGRRKVGRVAGRCEGSGGEQVGAGCWVLGAG